MKKVYIDTGIFFDYLKPKDMHLNNQYAVFFLKMISSEIRSKKRGNRKLSKLQNDAEKILIKSKENRIAAFTSVMTLIELEEQFFKTTKKVFSQTPFLDKFSIKASRDICKIFLNIIKTYRVKLIGIDKNIYSVMKNQELEIRDLIHLTIASENKCDILCSTDNHFHSLKRIRNKGNKMMLCADSDMVLKKI